MYSAGLLLKLLAVAALATSAVGQTTKDPMRIPMPTDVDTAPPTVTAPVPPPLPTTTPPTPPPPTPTPSLVYTPPPPLPPQPTCALLTNKDRVGFDLTSVRNSVDNCTRECLERRECVTWTWNDYNGGTCWLKSRAGRLIDKPGVTTTNCEYNTPMVCNSYTNIDFVGMDIGSRPGKTAGDCCDICNEFSGCTAYAWNNFNNGTCWLKNSVGQTEYKPGVTSSSMLPLYGGVCAAEYNVDFVGNDIGNKPAADPGVCCGLCKAASGCRAYTWSDYQGGTCWMKSSKGQTVTKNGVTSAKITVFYFK